MGSPPKPTSQWDYLNAQIAELREGEPFTEREGVIRSTNMSLGQACPRKYCFACRLGLLKKKYFDAKRAAHVGSFAHAAIAGMLCAPDPATHPVVAAMEVDKLLAKEEEATTRTLGGDAAGLAGMLPDTDKALADLAKDSRVGLIMALFFRKQVPVLFDRARWEPLKVESKLTATLPTGVYKIRASLIGRIDCVMKNVQTGEAWLMDHKTTGESPVLRALTFPFDKQARLYRLLWSICVPDVPLVGVIHNVILRPTIRLKKNQTLEEYAKEVEEWYEARRVESDTPAVVSSQIRYTEDLLEHEFLEQLRRASRQATAPIDFDEFYPNESTCLKFGKPCQYLDICRAPRHQWSSIIADGYGQRWREDDEDEETPE